MSTNRFTLKPIDDPWLGFLRAVDRELEDSTEIRCLGGFALLLYIEEPRPTGDIDITDVVPRERAQGLVGLAGPDSALAAEHKLYLQQVKVADPPCDYETRLLDATPGGFARLTIKILEPYDLILTKVQRDYPRDRQDARRLIADLGLDRDTLRRRFDEELKPYLAVAPERTTQIFGLWLEEFFPGESA